MDAAAWIEIVFLPFPPVMVKPEIRESFPSPETNLTTQAYSFPLMIVAQTIERSVGATERSVIALPLKSMFSS